MDICNGQTVSYYGKWQDDQRIPFELEGMEWAKVKKRSKGLGRKSQGSDANTRPSFHHTVLSYDEIDSNRWYHLFFLSN